MFGLIWQAPRLGFFDVHKRVGQLHSLPRSGGRRLACQRAPNLKRECVRADFDRGVAQKGLLDYNSIGVVILDGFVSSTARRMYFAQRFELFAALGCHLLILDVGADLARIVAGGPRNSGAATGAFFVGKIPWHGNINWCTAVESNHDSDERLCLKHLEYQVNPRSYWVSKPYCAKCYP